MGNMEIIVMENSVILFNFTHFDIFLKGVMYK